MAKQIMQDIVSNRAKDGEGAEPPKEALQKKDEGGDGAKSAAVVVKETSPEAVPREKKKNEDVFARAPAFPPIETSPIFEKMKQHNKDRENFSDEFIARRKNGWRRLFGRIPFIAGAVLVAGVLVYGIFFYDATLIVSLKHLDVSLHDQEFSAGGTDAGALGFQLMTLSDESSTELAATGEKNVESKASGKIVVYNDFGPQSQPLIKNTRFQAPDGKIYRIRGSIVVPGQKTADGKTVPGSLEVDVYADAPGAEYNIGLVDFTIPGFKGSPRYEKFYARGKTPMTGGFSGLTKIVSDADVEKAREKITAELKDALFAAAIAQKPKGAVLYKNAVSYDFTDSVGADAADKNPDDSSVNFTVKGSLTAVLFNAEDLSKRIVQTSIASVDASANDRILVTNIEELTFAPKGNAALPKEGETYAFLLNGTANAVWQIDAEALSMKLAGVKKADYRNVFADFPGIEKANARIRPFWKTKFPSDAAKIQVEISQD